MYCLADTPDGIVERHVETVKEFYASHKVGVGWEGRAAACTPPPGLVQLKAEQRMAAKVGETGSSISSEGESGTEEEEEGEEEVEESDTGDPPGEQPGRMVRLFLGVNCVRCPLLFGVICSSPQSFKSCAICTSTCGC